MSNLGSFITSTAWPFVAIHLAMLPNGDFVSWGKDYNANGVMDKIGIHRYDLQTKAFTHLQYSALVNTQNNPFCGGQILDMHGNLIVAGGQKKNSNGPDQNDDGTDYLGSIVPNANQNEPYIWSHYLTSLPFETWYPTAIPMPSGQLLIGGGTFLDAGEKTFVEKFVLFNAQTGQWGWVNAVNKTLDYYPQMYVLTQPVTVGLTTFPAGSVFYAGPLKETAILKFDPPVWSSNILHVGNDRPQGSSVMYLPMQIMTCGGGNPGTNTTEIIDLTETNPRWTDKRHDNSLILMNHAVRNHSLQILPNGWVLRIGGNGSSDTDYVFPLEYFNRETKTWHELANLPTPRWYHHVSALNIDATVTITGGEPATGYDMKACHIYIPPYLNKQYFRDNRPVITSCPDQMLVGNAYNVGVDDKTTIHSVCLIRLTSSTHGYNMGQQYVPLTFMLHPTQQSLIVSAPPNENHAPPGHYMLFVLRLLEDEGDVQIVPSVAKIVKINKVFLP